jgi:hypothetical protein
MCRTTPIASSRKSIKADNHPDGWEHSPANRFAVRRAQPATTALLSLSPDSSGVQEAGHTWQYPQDFEIRGDVQFIEQRGVGSKLLGSFNTNSTAPGLP